MGGNQRQERTGSVPEIYRIYCDCDLITTQSPREEGVTDFKQEKRNGTAAFTFGDVDIAFQVVDVKAPEKARDKVKQNAADVVAKPCPPRPRKRFPRPPGK